ncbi:sulfurase [Shimia sp.]|uniref:MOSC domain-containing protein n=1 Tax=Shimia sp. TaxID=1954381 RepID=UPI00329759A5
MPALKPTHYYAEIVWLGRVVRNDDNLKSEAVQALTLGLDGPEGEVHGGRTRKSCSRVLSQHPRGTEIANTRQLSIMSQEELDLIAQGIGLDALDPQMLGTSIVVRGIDDFTHVPPSSRLQGDSGATLVIDMENRPCVLPGRVIEDAHAGHGRAFKTAAKDHRGVTGWVERGGVLKLGDILRLHIPDQRPWSP